MSPTAENIYSTQQETGEKARLACCASGKEGVIVPDSSTLCHHPTVLSPSGLGATVSY